MALTLRGPVRHLLAPLHRRLLRHRQLRHHRPPALPRLPLRDRAVDPAAGPSLGEQRGGRLTCRPRDARWTYNPRLAVIDPKLPLTMEITCLPTRTRCHFQVL